MVGNLLRLSEQIAGMLARSRRRHDCKDGPMHVRRAGDGGPARLCDVLGRQLVSRCDAWWFQGCAGCIAGSAPMTFEHYASVVPAGLVGETSLLCGNS